jgi:hypothetical protein
MSLGEYYDLAGQLIRWLTNQTQAVSHGFSKLGGGHGGQVEEVGLKAAP